MTSSKQKAILVQSLTTVVFLFFLVPVASAQKQEEAEDYFKKWLKQDVLYVITEAERDVFERLTTPEEKERFIEQFWFRRDPDPRTSVNEFKEEHYRRIAYANEHFFSSRPGWMTDRGRIYIIHGPPTEIETHPTGGPYDRPIWEGGGTTVTFPFEVWRYRYIEGIGSDIVLEFVDPSSTREYNLALRPEEKDALLHTPGVGLTLAEESGDATRAERPYRTHDARINQAYPGMFLRAKDSPFDRYKQYALIERPKEIKYKDLQELVDIHVTYQNLPFQVRQDLIRLNEDQILVPVTVQLDNQHLTFEKGDRSYAARMAIYGRVTSITNRVVHEFEEDVRTSYAEDRFEAGRTQSSIYQKVLVLGQKNRYKLELVVKDLVSGKIGTVSRAIVAPAFTPEKLERSSLILSNFIRLLDEVPKDDERFVIGDVWIRPSLERAFFREEPLGVYLQVYNAGLDQASAAPLLRVRYQVFRDGEKVREIVDEQGQSTQFYSSQRVVLIRQLALDELAPGDYQIQVEVADLVSGQQVSAQEKFRVRESDRRVALGR